MKVYITTDMEGVTGVTCWDDVDETKPSYNRFRKILTAEVNASIEGALIGKATEFLVNDGHWFNRNVLIEELNPKAHLIIGNPKPLGQMCGVDTGVDIVFFIGYHAKGGTQNAIIDHSFSSSRVKEVCFNGISMGELGANAALAGHFGVPVGLVAGDYAATVEARELLGDCVQTVATKKALSREAAWNYPLDYVQGRIRMAAQEAVQGIPPSPYTIEGAVTVSVEFRHTHQADRASIMPGTSRTAAYTVEYEGKDILEAYNAMQAIINLNVQT